MVVSLQLIHFQFSVSLNMVKHLLCLLGLSIIPKHLFAVSSTFQRLRRIRQADHPQNASSSIMLTACSFIDDKSKATPSKLALPTPVSEVSSGMPDWSMISPADTTHHRVGRIRGQPHLANSPLSPCLMVRSHTDHYSFLEQDGSETISRISRSTALNSQYQSPIMRSSTSPGLGAKTKSPIMRSSISRRCASPIHEMQLSTSSSVTIPQCLFPKSNLSAAMVPIKPSGFRFNPAPRPLTVADLKSMSSNISMKSNSSKRTDDFRRILYSLRDVSANFFEGA